MFYRRRKLTKLDDVEHAVDKVKNWFAQREQDAEDGIVHNLDTIGTLPSNEGEFTYSVVTPGTAERFRKWEFDRSHNLTPKRIDFSSPQRRKRTPLSPMPSARKRSRIAGPSRYRSTLGRRPGKHGSRKHTTNSGSYTAFPDKALNSIRLVEINHGTDESQISQRRGDLVNVRGVKFRIWFRYDVTLQPPSNNFIWPLTVRWAIINPKNNNGGLGVPSTDFFISANPTTKVSVDFPGTGNWFDYMAVKINREEYGVLQEGSFTMSKDTTQVALTNGTILGDKQGWKMLDIWVPINKQMKFNSTLSAFPDVNLYFCWWFDIMGTDLTAQTWATGSPLEQFHQKTVYFSNAAMYS
jgi:hypothetical protein